MDKKRQKLFLSALQEMVEEKGIDTNLIVDAISEAFKFTYNKKLNEELLINKNAKVKKVVHRDEKGNVISEEKLNDALIKCDINLEKGTIDTYRLFKITNEDDIVDDFIEISKENTELINELGLVEDGEYMVQKLDFDNFSKGDVNRFISTYKQKISKAEKDALLDVFKGKIGELITGQVEKSDEHGTIVNLGRISVTLSPRDVIGRETFKAGENIRVYVQGFAKEDRKSSSPIRCSRSCPEFVEKLFENEVREVYDGTVKIYKVGRVAGVRSKVAVYSNEPNIDASGSCIGVNGNRIQAIVSQVNREYIDVIDYNPNLGVFLTQCLKPGIVVGIKFEDTVDGKIAYVLCEGETGIAAIGSKGINVILARQLTGLKEIKVFNENDPVAQDINFTPYSEFELASIEEEKERYRQESLKNQMNAQEIRKQIQETIVAPVVHDEELVDEQIENELEEEISTTSETNKEVVSTESKPTSTKVENIKEVKTTTTLSQLEESLEKAKKSSDESKNKEKNFKKKNFKKPEEKVQEIVINKPVNKMDVYTEEELKALEAEENENENYEEEEDYSDYDDDSYYDEN